MKDVDKLIDSIREFPTLPTIYSSLLDVLSNPFSTVKDVTDIIIRDQSVTSKIIKVANSPVFGISARVDTISQAIFFLGFNEIKNIVLTVSVMKVFSSTKNFTYFNFIDLWKHSIAVGCITRILGTKLGIKNVENYFISGLLHDLGKLVFYKIFGEEYAKILRYSYDNFEEIREQEKKTFGITHEIAGEILAEKWRFSTIMREVIKYHYVFRKNTEDDTLIACVHLANIIAIAMNLGNSGSNAIYQPNYEIWGLLNLPEGALTAMHDEIMDTYLKSIDILNYTA